MNCSQYHFGIVIEWFRGKNDEVGKTQYFEKLPVFFRGHIYELRQK